ncbi:50S ribosomal protein L24 [Ferrovibrio sp. MS7]|jgi:large subunit ribosomal protein L24|uniref:50S ribosomal protein L24 n=1 Tax=Ferrovibrio plantarum TaxID=3119164 RepID=UPI001B578061|nr:50S ribosomal protein L24 [Ferrovibrio sp.]
MAEKLKIKKGDKVVVTTGRSKGVKGEVLSVDRDAGRAVVAGANKLTHHTKPSRTAAGGIEQREASIDLSNLMHQDPKDGKPTRVGYKFLDDGRKVRFAKRSGEVIDR